MSASRRRFPQEFKDELCQEVITTSRMIKDVAVAYGVGLETLRNWLHKYSETQGGAEIEVTLDERARLKELERESAEGHTAQVLGGFLELRVAGASRLSKAG